MGNVAGVPSYNKRFGEMAVGVEAQVSASADPMLQFMVWCILDRHFAKLRNVV